MESRDHLDALRALLAELPPVATRSLGEEGEEEEEGETSLQKSPVATPPFPAAFLKKSHPSNQDEYITSADSILFPLRNPPILPRDLALGYTVGALSAVIQSNDVKAKETLNDFAAKILRFDDLVLKHVQEMLTWKRHALCLRDQFQVEMQENREELEKCLADMKSGSPTHYADGGSFSTLLDTIRFSEDSESAPLSSMLLRCSDCLESVFSYLPFFQVVCGVGSACSGFRDFIKKRVPVSVRLFGPRGLRPNRRPLIAEYWDDPKLHSYESFLQSFTRVGVISISSERRTNWIHTSAIKRFSDLQPLAIVIERGDSVDLVGRTEESDAGGDRWWRRPKTQTFEFDGRATLRVEAFPVPPPNIGQYSFLRVLRTEVLSPFLDCLKNLPNLVELEFDYLQSLYEIDKRITEQKTVQGTIDLLADVEYQAMIDERLEALRAWMDRAQKLTLTADVAKSERHFGALNHGVRNYDPVQQASVETLDLARRRSDPFRRVVACYWDLVRLAFSANGCPSLRELSVTIFGYPMDEKERTIDWESKSLSRLSLQFFGLYCPRLPRRIHSDFSDLRIHPNQSYESCCCSFLQDLSLKVPPFVENISLTMNQRAVLPVLQFASLLQTVPAKLSFCGDSVYLLPYCMDVAASPLLDIRTPSVTVDLSTVNRTRERGAKKLVLPKFLASSTTLKSLKVVFPKCRWDDAIADTMLDLIEMCVASPYLLRAEIDAKVEYYQNRHVLNKDFFSRLVDSICSVPKESGSFRLRCLLIELVAQRRVSSDWTFDQDDPAFYLTPADPICEMFLRKLEGLFEVRETLEFLLVRYGALGQLFEAELMLQ